MEVIIVAIIVAIAAAAVLVAVITNFKNIYLQQVFAATYQLAGALSMQNDDGIPDETRMDDYEFNCAVTLLLDVLADPNSPAAEQLIGAAATDSYATILERASEHAVDFYPAAIDTPAPHEDDNVEPSKGGSYH